MVGCGAFGGPRPHFAAAAGNINIHPQQQQQQQQQGFGGPHFGVDSFVRPTGHPGTRGGIHSRSQLSQQQSPHKILINPHFRGAVQPHPEGNTCHFNIFLQSSFFTLQVIPSSPVLYIPSFYQPHNFVLSKKLWVNSKWVFSACEKHFCIINERTVKPWYGATVCWNLWCYITGGGKTKCRAWPRFIIPVVDRLLLVYSLKTSY